jgi:hypothetical protein
MSSTTPGQAGRTAGLSRRSTDTGSGGAEPTAEERAVATAVLRMIWGTHIARAVHVVAELGIADRLTDGPVSCAELARDTGTHEASLYRVLRLLAGLGVVP